MGDWGFFLLLLLSSSVWFGRSLSSCSLPCNIQRWSCLYIKPFYDNGIMYREVGHDRPEELASGNMCGIRPRRMECLVMAIPKWNKTTKGFVGLWEILKKLNRKAKAFMYVHTINALVNGSKVTEPIRYFLCRIVPLEIQSEKKRDSQPKINNA